MSPPGLKVMLRHGLVARVGTVGWPVGGVQSAGLLRGSVPIRCGPDSGVLTPHALRHSFVTNLLRVDVPLYVVAFLAGPRDGSTTMRYAAIAVDPLAELLAA